MSGTPLTIDIDDLIKRGDQDALKQLPAWQVIDFSERKHYPVNQGQNFGLHGLAHIIAAGLTNQDMLLDSKKAAKIKPLYQAGFEAEYIAEIYDRVFRQRTSEKRIKALEGLDTKQRAAKIFAWAQEIQQQNTVINITDIDTLKRRADSEGFYSSHAAHNAGAMSYLRYLEKEKILENDVVDKVRLWKPSVEEMAWHLKKALELRERLDKKFATSTKDPDSLDPYGDFLMSLPLEEFIIDNISPWDRNEQAQRTEMHKAMYKNKEAGGVFL